MNEQNLELAAQAGLQQRFDNPNEIWGYRADLERFADLVRQDERKAQVCCGDYEKCIKACTPRGRWLANQQMTRLEQEKRQFVGGVPNVSQQREWVGLTSEDWENTPNTGKQGCERDVEMFDWIEQTLKDKNT